MVKANNSWLYSQNFPWQLPNLNCMSTPIEPGHLECLPAGVNPGMFSENMTMPRSAGPVIPSLKVEEAYDTHSWLQYLHSPFRTLLNSTNLYPKERQSVFTYGLPGKSTLVTSGSSQKRFLVFDQSGNQTRLIYSSPCPAVVPNAAVSKFVCGTNLHEEGKAVNVAQFTPKEAILPGKSDENDVNGEETEMHEDTEEINALLYSDEDNDYGESDDEVMSTDHSPFAIEGTYNKQEHVNMMEEVASSGHAQKRQKLLNGGYNKVSLVGTATSEKLEGSNEDDIVVESSYGIDQTKREEMGSTSGSKQSRKDHIHWTLRVLESIIPGVKGKDPLLVLDEAIEYLKLLKHKAKDLQANDN